VYLPSEQELINYRLYLLGYNVESLGRLVTPDDERVPLLATPFRRHLNEVNRFLFNGGVVVDTHEMGPKQEWVTSLADTLKLSSRLDDLWESIAIYGQVMLGIHPDGNGLYRWVAYTNFTLNKDANGVVESAEGRVVKDGSIWITRYNKETYEIYKPLKLGDYAIGTKPTLSESIPHPYRFTPVQELRNNTLGTSEFDLGAIDMAVEIALQVSAAGDNLYYFGNQMIASPNREETLQVIQNRSRVLTREAEADGGVPVVLDIKPTPEGYEKYVEDLNNSLAEHLGSPIVKLNLRSDLSSLTLKLTHQGVISTASKKWQSIITEGIEPAFGLMLLMSAYEGARSDVTLTDPASFKVDIMRKAGFFEESPLERKQKLEVVSALIELGIRPTYVLAEEYYGHLTEAQVEALMEPGSAPSLSGSPNKRT